MAEENKDEEVKRLNDKIERMREQEDARQERAKDTRWAFGAIAAIAVVIILIVLAVQDVQYHKEQAERAQNEIACAPLSGYEKEYCLTHNGDYPDDD